MSATNPVVHTCTLKWRDCDVADGHVVFSQDCSACAAAENGRGNGNETDGAFCCQTCDEEEEEAMGRRKG